VKIATDTSVASAASVGIVRGGDVASGLIGVLQQHAKTVRREGMNFAKTVRREVLEYLETHSQGATADEIAYALRHSVLTVRPRVSELARKKPPIVVDSGRRGTNSSGRRAIVWLATQPRLEAARDEDER